MQLMDPKYRLHKWLCDLFIDQQNHLDQSGLTLKLKALDVPEAKTSTTRKRCNVTIDYYKIIQEK